MNPYRTAVWRVVEDIPDTPIVKGNYVVLTLAEGPGARQVCPEAIEIMRWIGEGRLEEVSGPDLPSWMSPPSVGA
jgi:hypothetical protein